MNSRPSLSQLYQRAVNTGVGAPNIPWCGKRYIFSDDDYKNNNHKNNLEKDSFEEIKKLKKENKKLRKLCSKLLKKINNSNDSIDLSNLYVEYKNKLDTIEI